MQNTCHTAGGRLDGRAHAVAVLANSFIGYTLGADFGISYPTDACEILGRQKRRPVLGQHAQWPSANLVGSWPPGMLAFTFRGRLVDKGKSVLKRVRRPLTRRPTAIAFLAAALLAHWLDIGGDRPTVGRSFNGYADGIRRHTRRELADSLPKASRADSSP